MLIPIGVDVPMTRPWVNYAIVGVTSIVSVFAFYDVELLKSLAMFGTSCLVHAGYLHLIGNMLFLWVFGNAVNYKFGHLGYMALYAAAAMAADASHLIFHGGMVVGASGAIYGVMGAFLVFFPRNDVKMLLWLFLFYVKYFTLSSFWVILFWVGWDVFSLSTGGEKGVALWSHVGGFSFGFLAAMLCAKRGWVKPAEDEETLLQVLAPRKKPVKSPARPY
jgi:membrane associated rhomboid family serine protease